MEEKNLVFVALLCCLCGTLVILFLAEKLEAPLYASSEINASMEGKKILVQGYLYDTENFGKITKFRIKDTTGSMTFVVFDEDLRLKENSFVIVKGEVSVFNNITEIDAKEIYAS